MKRVHLECAAGVVLAMSAGGEWQAGHVLSTVAYGVLACVMIFTS